MPFTDSRLGPGTLSLGPTATAQDFSFQVSNCRRVPSINEEDGTPTLGNPTPPPIATLTWALEGTVIADFTAAPPTSFVLYCEDHALESIEYTFTPVTGNALKWAGKVQIRPVEQGGDVATQITVDFSFPEDGPTIRTDPTVLELAGAAAE